MRIRTLAQALALLGLLGLPAISALTPAPQGGSSGASPALVIDSGDLTEVVKTLNSVYPGLVTFTAFSGTELSEQRDAWRHGAFTKALLEGLAGKADGIVSGQKDGRIDTLELGTWLSRRVAELTGGKNQHANFDSGGVPPFPLFQVET
jgi:hypothetical protein